MTELLKYEILIQNRIYNFSKYFAIFFLFCLTSVGFVSSYEKIHDFGVISSVILLPLALISITNGFLRSEIEDGFIELLLTSFEPITIVLAKYFALLVAMFTGFLINLSFAALLFDVSLSKLAIMTSCGIHLGLLSTAVILLIASVQCYFRSNTSFLSVLLMPLIIPSLILCGVLLQGGDIYSLTLILLGINCIIIPVVIYLSSYLIANIYNI